MTAATQEKAMEKQDKSADMLERVLVDGDLAKLSPAQRVSYYLQTCESMSLNHLTKPFDYIVLNGKLRLYATKACTDQLRDKRKVSITRLEREVLGDLYVVTAYARGADGREDSDMGAVSVKGLTGEALVNAMLKAVTKAKRRVTLSLCGLGWLDETEISSIPGATTVAIDHTTGEVVQERKAMPAAAPAGEVREEEFATEYDETIEHAVCVECERIIRGPDKKPITPEQSEQIVKRYGSILCREHRASQPQPATAA